MSLTLDTSINLPAPKTRAHGEVGTSSTRGFQATCRSLNTLFVQKRGAIISDWNYAGIFGTATAPVQTVSWKVHNDLYCGLTGSNARVTVWFYYVMSSTTGTWNLRVSEPGGGTLTVDMHKLSTSAGEWASVGFMNFDDTVTDGAWSFEETANTGLSGGSYIRGIVIEMKRDASSAPALLGGYLHAGAGVIPFDDAAAYGTLNPVSTWMLRAQHAMAIYLWRQRLGQIQTSSMHYLYNGSGTSAVLSQGLHLVPHGVTACTFYVRDSKTGAGTTRLFIDGEQADAGVLDNLGGWTELNGTVTPGAIHEFRITATKSLDSICGSWDVPEY